jgi:G:T-mismatch repair DNA endonuclease (very short patch repair protein)
VCTHQKGNGDIVVDDIRVELKFIVLVYFSHTAVCYIYIYICTNLKVGRSSTNFALNKLLFKTKKQCKTKTLFFTFSHKIQSTLIWISIHVKTLIGI